METLKNSLLVHQSGANGIPFTLLSQYRMKGLTIEIFLFKTRRNNLPNGSLMNYQ